METKRTGRIMVSFIVLFGLLVVFTGLTFFFGNRTLFFIEVGVVLLVLFFALVLVSRFKSETRVLLESVIGDIDVKNKENIKNFPFPAIFLSRDGQILWYNDLFKKDVIGDKPFNERIFSNVWTSEKREDFYKKSGLDLTYEGKMYTVYGIATKSEIGSTLFLVDNTYYKELEKEFKDSRLSVLQIIIDNFDEIFDDVKDSDRSRVLGEIEYVFERFTSSNKAFFRRLNRDRYVAVIEKKQMDILIKDRFPILDEIKKIKSPGRISVTVSIGVGQNGKDIIESDILSKQALDMALGRGGDQVAIKTPEKYEFFGGVSTGVESSSKVKTRIMATALSKIIDEADSCIVMGHKMADMDSFGSVVGMATAIRRTGKNAFVAINKENNQVGELLNKLEDQGYDDLFLEPEKALEKMGRNSLVVITDTHTPHMVESREIYEKANSVVVIDHHRRMVGYIEDAVLFFHETSASSASEMVTELIPYLEMAGPPEPLEAEALLAGITLDTKSFTLKTGVRTFEAAAYLKRHGADTVAVKKLFSTSEETYNKKVQVVSGSEIYGDYAIATTELTGSDMNLIAPQAADELLTIRNVAASFVLYKSATGKIQVSARSYGDVNVQIIMEALDGGGHLTMAGASLNLSLKDAEIRLKSAIDEYHKANDKKTVKAKDLQYVGEKEEEKEVQSKLENLTDILAKE